MIRVITNTSHVIVTYEGGGVELDATGDTLTAAVEALVRRFKELQDGAIDELYARGFIRVERVAKEVVS